MDSVIQTSPSFWIIIFGYFAIVLGFGSFFARYNKTTQDFFFSGRRFSWWLITMSIVATGVGSHSFLKYSAKAYEHGFSSTMTYMNDWFFMPTFFCLDGCQLFITPKSVQFQIILKGGLTRAFVFWQRLQYWVI